LTTEGFGEMDEGEELEEESLQEYLPQEGF
jgi:hypothetical protein